MATGSAAAKPVAMERRACPPVGEQCFLFLRNLGRPAGYESLTRCGKPDCLQPLAGARLKLHPHAGFQPNQPPAPKSRDSCGLPSLSDSVGGPLDQIPARTARPRAGICGGAVFTVSRESGNILGAAGAGLGALVLATLVGLTTVHISLVAS